jgi:GST-like protein
MSPPTAAHRCLAEKTGRFLPRDFRGRWDCLQWLYWQVGGLGPMAGQNHHFGLYAAEKIPYAIDRYVNETGRLYAVLNRRLADRAFVAGDYSIADIACYPWIRPERQRQNIDDFPHIKRWKAEIAARPAVVRAYEIAKTVNPAGALPLDDKTRQVLFGQNKDTVR